MAQQFRTFSRNREIRLGQARLAWIRQRGQLSSDCPPAVTNDGAAKGGQCADGRASLGQGYRGYQYGVYTAYRRLDVFPCSLALSANFVLTALPHNSSRTRTTCRASHYQVRTSSPRPPPVTRCSRASASRLSNGSAVSEPHLSVSTESASATSWPAARATADGHPVLDEPPGLRRRRRPTPPQRGHHCRMPKRSGRSPRYGA